MTDHDEPGASLTPAPEDLVTLAAKDPETRALDREIVRTRARMIERLQELDRRIARAREVMNIAQLIRRHPLAAIAIGLAAGALIGLPRGHGGGAAS